MQQSAGFRVDRSFDGDATSEHIYEDLVKPLVPCAWGGGIGTLFAYGQTGSGKTFTVTQLGDLLAQTLMGNKMLGERKISMTIFELAGNSPFGMDTASSR